MKSLFKYVLFSILILFAFTIKSNAKAVMCTYKRDDGEKSAIIYIENGRYFINFDGFDASYYSDTREMAGFSALTILSPPAALAYAYMWGSPEYYVREKNGISYFDGSTFMLRHNKTLAQEIFYDDDELPSDIDSDDVVETEKINVEWRSSSEKEKFDQYGFCPSIVVNDTEGFFSDTPSIIFATSDTVVSTDDNGIIGNTLFNLESSRIESALIDSVSSINSCLTNADDISAYAKIFSMDEDGIKDVDKRMIAKLYKNNGLDESARKIIEDYSTDGTCVSENPSLKANYVELYSAANSFLTIADKSYKQSDVDKCSDVIGNSKFAYYLDMTFKFIQYLAPILVIVLSTVSYAKAFFSGDADSLKKVNKETIIRLIFAALLFIIPAIIRLLLHIVGLNSDCGVANL